MINHDKAYVLGLFVGGGTISQNTFLIKLPFKKWGMEPAVMNKIAVDILTRICDKFQSAYNFPVTYEIGNSIWVIKPMNNPDIGVIKKDLEDLSIPSEGVILNDVCLDKAKKVLKGIATENFLTGIFDTRASIALTHRRFNNNAPVVSIEIPGSTRNFAFVVQFCSWLTDLGSVTDQILFNHPCQHCGADPTYKGWKKGFKIRFLIKSFIAKHSFALRAKSFDVQIIEKLQEIEAQEPCINRKIKKPSPVSIHNDIHSPELPEEVRSKLFFHYFHFCAVLGCKYAPLKELSKITNKYSDFVFVLPRSEKGNVFEIKKAYKHIHEKYFSDKIIEYQKIKIEDLTSSDDYKSYIELGQGLAYLFSEVLNGKRHKGSMKAIIKSNLDSCVLLGMAKGTKKYPIILINEKLDRAVMVSSLSSKLNQELILKNIEQNDFDINIIE